MILCSKFYYMEIYHLLKRLSLTKLAHFSLTCFCWTNPRTILTWKPACGWRRSSRRTSRFLCWFLTLRTFWTASAPTSFTWKRRIWSIMAATTTPLSAQGSSCWRTNPSATNGSKTRLRTWRTTSLGSVTAAPNWPGKHSPRRRRWPKWWPEDWPKKCLRRKTSHSTFILAEQFLLRSSWFR